MLIAFLGIYSAIASIVSLLQLLDISVWARPCEFTGLVQGLRDTRELLARLD